MIDINPVTLNTEIIQGVSEKVLIIPADYFYCPYWLLNIGGFFIFALGIIIGIGSIYGWKRLFFRILTLWNQI
jgi:hypothetical protein